MGYLVINDSSRIRVVQVEDREAPIILEVAPTSSVGGGGSGSPGLSAYEIALQNGFVGTEAQWLASLVGPTGPTGATGPPGSDGEDGIGIPAGGTTGQTLIKSSDTDYDTTWGVPGLPDAEDIGYDNIGSGLTATNVQDAIDELEEEIDAIVLSGEVQNPMQANLDAAGYAISGAAYLGFVDRYYDLSDDNDGLINDDIVALVSDYNAYYHPNLTTGLTLKLPTSATDSAAPFGIISVALGNGGAISIDSTPAYVWGKASANEDNPTLPSEEGNAFAIRYRYEPAIGKYVLNLETFAHAAPGTSDTFNFTATGIDDDGWSNHTNGVADTGAVVVYIGSDGTDTRSSYLRLSSVPIPQGATIDSATVTLITYTSYGSGSWTWRWRGLDVDNASAVYPPANHAAFVAWDRTTAFVDETAQAPLGYRVAYESKDLSEIIQEIVNRPGWQAGNDIVLIMDYLTSTTTHIQFRAASSQNWTAQIQYTT